MVFAAKELLQLEGLDNWSIAILEKIAILDSYGLQDVNPWAFSLGSAVFFFTIFETTKPFIGELSGPVYNMAHAAIVASAAWMCLYLNYSGVAKAVTGTTEPVCEPLTSLHRIVPAITEGWLLVDLYDCLTNNFGVDMLFHCFCSFVGISSLMYTGASQVATPILQMEAPIFFMNILPFRLPGMVWGAVLATFLVLYIVCRIIILPVVYYRLIARMVYHYTSDPCEGVTLTGTIGATLSGGFLTILSYFWMYRITLKIITKLQGKEGWQEGNKEMAQEVGREGNDKPKKA